MEGYGLHAAIVVQRHGHAMGIQCATATILVGCDLGATASRRKSRGCAWGEWQRDPQVEGKALALDPHLYPENGQKSLVNQWGMAERVPAFLGADKGR